MTLEVCLQALGALQANPKTEWSIPYLLERRCVLQQHDWRLLPHKSRNFDRGTRTCGSMDSAV